MKTYNYNNKVVNITAPKCWVLNVMVEFSSPVTLAQKFK